MKKNLFLLFTLAAIISFISCSKDDLQSFLEGQTNVTSITLNKTSLTLRLNETYTLEATVLPATAKNNELAWTSSNQSVVDVSNSGVVMSKDYGTATITCSATDGSGVKTTCTVTVTPQGLPGTQVGEGSGA